MAERDSLNACSGLVCEGADRKTLERDALDTDAIN